MVGTSLVVGVALQGVVYLCDHRITECTKQTALRVYRTEEVTGIPYKCMADIMEMLPKRVAEEFPQLRTQGVGPNGGIVDVNLVPTMRCETLRR